MKRNKILKITVITLLVILLSIISFGGIFIPYKNSMKNLIPDYKLSRELTGSRRIQIKVDDTVETKNYDSEGNEIKDTDTNEDGTKKEIARTEEIPANKEEDLTAENYRKAREILENRLKFLGLTDYTIRLNEDDGTMLFELPEDANVDITVAQIRAQGKLEIIDAETKEVIMTNDDLEDVFAQVGSTTSGYSAYMQLQFNKEKYREMTKTYVKTTDEEGKTTEKKVTLKVDDEDVLSTSFEEEEIDGILQLTVGSSHEDINAEELKDSYLNAVTNAGILSSGKSPIVYTTEQNKYVLSDISIDILKIAIYVGIAIVIVGLLYLIIRYKKLGILTSITFIGYIALMLIVFRCIPNIEISIGGICAIALAIIINYVVNMITLNKLKEIEDERLALKNAMIKIMKMLIPALIVSIVFTFWDSSFGIVTFWSLAIIIIYNYLITKTLITGNKKVIK